MFKKIKVMYRLTLFRIFIWSGSKVFNYVTVYAPGNDDVKAVHFGDSFTSIVRSLEELHAMDHDCTCDEPCDDCSCN